MVLASSGRGLEGASEDRPQPEQGQLEQSSLPAPISPLGSHLGRLRPPGLSAPLLGSPPGPARCPCGARGAVSELAGEQQGHAAVPAAGQQRSAAAARAARHVPNAPQPSVEAAALLLLLQAGALLWAGRCPPEPWRGELLLVGRAGAPTARALQSRRQTGGAHRKAKQSQTPPVSLVPAHHILLLGRKGSPFRGLAGSRLCARRSPQLAPLPQLPLGNARQEPGGGTGAWYPWEPRGRLPGPAQSRAGGRAAAEL